MGNPEPTNERKILISNGDGTIQRIADNWAGNGKMLIAELDQPSSARFGTTILPVPFDALSDHDIPLAIPGSRCHYLTFYRITESGQKEHVQMVWLEPAGATASAAPEATNKETP